jgi:hypothetical protein
MLQTTLCVPLEVKPESCSRLSVLIAEFRERKYPAGRGFADNYQRIKIDVPALHFMSMSVFPSASYDPIFILEANFDGETGAFWSQIEAAFGEELRAMLRCCKKPLDEDGPLYDAVTAPGSRAPIAAYLEARTQRPSVFHHGNRGLTRDRILDDRTLFLAVRDEIDTPNGPSPYRAMDSVAAHATLRERLLPHFPWLKDEAPVRISTIERARDLFRLMAFAVVALLVLSLPGLALAPFLPWRSYLVLMAACAAIIAFLVYTKRAARPGTEIAAKFPWGIVTLPNLLLLALAVTAYVAVATVILTPVVWAVSHFIEWLGAGQAFAFGTTWRPVARTVLLSLASVFVTVPLILLWLRYLERRDSSHDAPPVDERTLREMVRREDWIAQNHMGSIVLIKPGILRGIIIRAGHLGLGWLLRVKATDGYLGSMRTVHFAHWAFLNNGSRLLFFSNFDQSWDSYLDDFIEKAAKGLTIAWGCGVGFPPTRFLIYDGAAHGRRFKNWALGSRAVSRFWYSAYRELTVDQIERNHRIANGLRKPSMSAADATAWMRDL